MRIAVVAGFPPDPYGEAHYTGQVFCSLAKQFPDIDILILAHKNRSAPNRQQVLPNLKVRRITRPGNRFRATIALIPLLYQVVRYRPDVVHLQGTHTPRYGGLFGEPITILVGILRLMNIGVLFTTHSIWLPAELADLWARKHIPKPLSRFFTLLYGANLRFISLLSNVLSFAVAGENSCMVDSYQRAYSLVTQNITSEIHPCTGLPTSRERQSLAKAQLGLSDHTIVSAIGLVRADKGYHLILDCADDLLAEFPNVAIVVAGMPQGAEGQRYAETLDQSLSSVGQKDRVILKMEYLSDEDFENYMAATDVMVVPYLEVPGPSGPIHHALGHGIPVVASAIGHNLGLDSVCRLFPSGDPVALHQVLRELLRSPRQMEESRSRSIAYAGRHSWDDLALQYARLYYKVTHKSIEEPLTGRSS